MIYFVLNFYVSPIFAWIKSQHIFCFYFSVCKFTQIVFLCKVCMLCLRTYSYYIHILSKNFYNNFSVCCPRMSPNVYLVYISYGRLSNLSIVPSFRAISLHAILLTGVKSIIKKQKNFEYFSGAANFVTLDFSNNLSFA